MLKAMQAEFYRLFRSKGFWITQGLLLAFVTMMVLTEATGSIGIVDMSSEEAAMVETVVEKVAWTGQVATLAATNIGSILIYLCLPFFVMIIGHDLTRKTYKNMLTTGLSRFDFFSSKFMIFMVTAALQMLTYYGTTFLMAGLKNGFGDLNGEFWKTLLTTMGFQFVNLLAVFAIASVFLYLTFSNVTAVVAAIMIPLVISILKIVLKWEIFDYTNFQTNIDTAVNMEASSKLFQSSILASIACMVICLGIAYPIFKRKSL